MPGIIKRRDHKKVKRPTRKLTLKADQKSLNPQKESATSGFVPDTTLRYTLTRLNAKAGDIIITEIKGPTKGIKLSIKPAAPAIKAIIKEITNKIPIFPLIWDFAADFNSALFIKFLL